MFTVPGNCTKIGNCVDNLCGCTESLKVQVSTPCLQIFSALVLVRLLYDLTFETLNVFVAPPDRSGWPSVLVISGQQIQVQTQPLPNCCLPPDHTPATKLSEPSRSSTTFNESRDIRLLSVRVLCTHVTWCTAPSSPCRRHCNPCGRGCTSSPGNSSPVHNKRSSPSLPHQASTLRTPVPKCTGRKSCLPQPEK